MNNPFLKFTSAGTSVRRTTSFTSNSVLIKFCLCFLFQYRQNTTVSRDVGFFRESRATVPGTKEIFSTAASY